MHIASISASFYDFLTLFGTLSLIGIPLLLASSIDIFIASFMPSSSSESYSSPDELKLLFYALPLVVLGPFG